MDIGLIIVTLLLAFITGFYTFNLSRIEVFDKRYKIYESLLRLIEFSKHYEEINIFFKTKSSSDDPMPLYNTFYGNIYDNFNFHIESSRFLFSKDVYKFLMKVKENADNVKDYIWDELHGNQNSKKEKNCNDSIEQLRNNELMNEINKLFNPYLEFEENIIIYVLKKLLSWLKSAFFFTCQK